MNKLSEFIISGGIDLKNLYPDDFRELTKSVFLKKIKKEFSNLGEDFKLEKQAGIYKNSFIGISSDFVIIFY
ncbi:MAG TPA: hypothetical protein EYG89_06450, partial [Bacteroidia bacterium]|nr:hypothetical protein [Bacteroidia bacterium]